MKREIKFRVWNKIGKRMYDWPISINNYIDDSNCVLMQFTGLQDKDGKDIYEGDILANDYEDEENPENTRPSVVVWSNEQARFECDDVLQDEQLYLACPSHNKGTKAEFFVIGNIYENPELLKEK